MLRWWLILLVGSTLIPPALLKRGGGGGFGRGSSGSRMGGRISSGSRTGGGFGSSGGHSSGGGGIFGGHKSSGGGYSGGTGGMSGSHNMGRKPAGTGFNTRPQDSRSGGWFGRNRNYGGGGFHTSRYNSGSGRGSFMRSNQFKNMIVGAAAGYLTYQAGKHIIRSMTSPMMWGNRPYYWGQQYYQPRHGYNQMCRMPIQPGDTQFGNIYQQDGISRPKELVWGCGPYEACCGMECCYVGGGNANQPLSVGSLLIMLFIVLVAFMVIFHVCKKRREQQQQHIFQ